MQDSPGPIYDSAPGAASTKSKKSFWDPRNCTRTGFLNSGCSRSTDFYNIDKDIPCPSIYYAKLPKCCREPGKTPSVDFPRFKDLISQGPGPAGHKLHEKVGSSMWRASHLGTHNSFLKRVGILFPWAGGFRKKNLTQAGDAVWKIERENHNYCPVSLVDEEAKSVKKFPKVKTI
jgi:hypothetical protein